MDDLPSLDEALTFTKAPPLKGPERPEVALPVPDSYAILEEDAD